MKRFWALLFLLVPIFGIWMFAAAPSRGWWLPEDVSSYGHKIDALFYVILGITGVVFLITQAVLVWFMFRYAGSEGKKGFYIHGHHMTELVWTVIPAIILVFIAFTQMGTWKAIKFQGSFPPGPPLAEITAGQFEWRIRYAGLDGTFGTDDDLHVLNDFHVPVNAPVVFHLKSRDVLHSFFVPNLRLKQDAVPGTTIPVWFEAKREGQYELVCAELCGWGHYKMKGRVTVQSGEAFVAWLKSVKEEQEADE